MIKIGVTGQNGFVGLHLRQSLGLLTDRYRLIEFQREFFENEKNLDGFVLKCDVIIHLAALNRHKDQEIIYKTNIDLVNKLVASLERVKSNAHIIMSSSSQEEKDNLYGKSKKEGRNILRKWTSKNNSIFTGMIIPNVFGPFGIPFYNSVVATFCHQITCNKVPKIEIDGELKLIYIDELVSEIITVINNKINKSSYLVSHTKEIKVSGILELLKKYKDNYQDHGGIPELKNIFELNLFNTYRSYIDIKNHFPVKFTKHTDSRGSFVEIVRLGVGGQVSFSTTVSGITRGNHYHTRKIERFAVIKGKALIQLRRIGTEEVLEFYLDGDEPSFVDMPIWYTHNIKNIGKEILFTNFWINELYDELDADTYFEEV